MNGVVNMQLKKTDNSMLVSFCGREYFKEVGLNNYYCLEDGTLYFCSKDGEPNYEINEPYQVV